MRLLLLVELLCFSIFQSTAQFSQIRFLANSSIFPGNRDGIVIATLSNGEETSISNYRFTEVEAKIVCVTLGYPPIGLSVINNESPVRGKVLLGDFKCTGFETNLKYCINSGRKELHSIYGSHKMDAHVYCLEPKATSSNSISKDVTTCNKNVDIILNRSPNKTNTGFPQIKINGKGHYICNEHFNFGMKEAGCFCNKMCKNVVNARPVMFLSRSELQINSNSSFASVSCTDCECKFTPVNSCDPSYTAGVQCGDEPVLLEKSPTVNCTSENMTVTWPNTTLPIIKGSLVNISPTCHNATITENKNGDILVIIPLGDCNPTITDESLHVKYSYKLQRMYIPVGLTKRSPAMLTVECRILKHDSLKSAVVFKKPLYSSLSEITKTNLEMSLYEDGSFAVPVPQGHTYDITKLIYLKVFMKNPPKDIKLGLYNCEASPTKNFVGSKIVNLISNSCPNKDFDVQMTYLNVTEIGIQFRPFDFIGNDKSPIYVKCETTKCYFGDDHYCKVCNTASRSKRSVNESRTTSIVKGPIHFS